VPELVVVAAAVEEPRDRLQLDGGERDEVVGPDEDVELARVQPADALVEDGKVQDGEQVAARLVLGVDVDLRPLTAREDVLDVEWVPAEAVGQHLSLPVGGSLEMDPGEPVLVELSDLRPSIGRDRARGSAARTDARQIGHRY